MALRRYLVPTTLLFFLLLGPPLLVGCKKEPEVKQEQATGPVVIEHDEGALQGLSPRDLRELRPAKLKRLSAGEPELFEACRFHFEPPGGPAKTWPFEDHRSALALFGCGPEAFLEFDGYRVVAYPISMEDHDRAYDLRILFFEPSGELRFESLMSRSDEAQNYAANFRGSFLTRPNQALLCAGTLWQGGTQLHCLRTESGEPVFSGRMDFWAGLAPFGLNGSLFSTDTRGITRRYPFTGAEMRHRAFEGRGGRAAFYGDDGKRIFFSSPDGEPLLSGWDVESLRPLWRLPLPGAPMVTLSYANAELDLLLFKIDDALYGVNSETGEPRFAFLVGEALPRIAFGDEELLLLLRRNEEPPLIYSLSPADGEIHWVSLAPMGILEIQVVKGDLLMRSVRAVRKARLPDPRSLEDSGEDPDE